MLVLVPHKSQPRGKHGYNPATSTSCKQAVTNVASDSSNMLNLRQLSSAINASGSSLSPSKDTNPDVIPPSAPSSYLAASSATSSGIHVTSISHGKRKADAPSELYDSSRKCSRAPMVAAQAQLEGSAAMQDIATAFK